MSASDRRWALPVPEKDHSETPSSIGKRVNAWICDRVGIWVGLHRALVHSERLWVHWVLAGDTRLIRCGILPVGAAPSPRAGGFQRHFWKTLRRAGGGPPTGVGRSRSGLGCAAGPILNADIAFRTGWVPGGAVESRGCYHRCPPISRAFDPLPTPPPARGCRKRGTERVRG